MTLFSAVKGWGRLVLPILFFAAKRFPRLTGKLRELSFVHFARWALVTEIPYNGPPQPKQKLRYARLYFDSNFNGGWHEYIDAFAHILTRGMSAFWGSSYGFPKALPVERFKLYIDAHETEASYYYSAYPGATTKMIHSALELGDKLAPLKQNAKGMEPDAFAEAYRKMLTDAQRCL